MRRQGGYFCRQRERLLGVWKENGSTFGGQRRGEDKDGGVVGEEAAVGSLGAAAERSEENGLRCIVGVRAAGEKVTYMHAASEFVHL